MNDVFHLIYIRRSWQNFNHIWVSEFSASESDTFKIKCPVVKSLSVSFEFAQTLLLDLLLIWSVVNTFLQLEIFTHLKNSLPDSKSFFKY